MSNILKEAFSSVHSVDSPPDDKPHQTASSSLSDFIIDESSVLIALESPNKSSSMGPDGIHPFFLYSCRKELTYPLTLLFQKSYASSTLPPSWKESIVIPIFKKGAKKCALNHRPISLSSPFGKTCERVIVPQLTLYLERNNHLSPDQFSFRKNRCVEDQLLLTYDYIHRGVDIGQHIDLLLLDFSKAFDVVKLTISTISSFDVSYHVLESLDWLFSGS